MNFALVYYSSIRYLHVQNCRNSFQYSLFYSFVQNETGYCCIVAMWNRALDEKEIISVMNSGLQLLLSVDQIDKLATTWAKLKK